MEKTEKTPGFLGVALWISILLVLMIVPPAFAIVIAGPDDFGYIASETASNLRDISTTGTSVTLGDDEVSSGIPLPFPFLFYGVAFTQVFISSNGFITFSPGQPDGCCQGQPIPSDTQPNNLIAAFWEDLNPGQGGTIVYETRVLGGNREFIVGFYNVPHYSGPQVTFEIILQEAGSTIELQYGSAPSDNDAQFSTVGIENVDSTDGLQIAHGDVSFDHEGFLITRPMFETFKVRKASISFGREEELDSYELEGELTLSEFSDVIDPSEEDIFITVGASTLTIPVGSFESKRRRHHLEFNGSVDGVFIHAIIKAAGPRTFRYRFAVHDVDLTYSPIPINFTLKIGADEGFTTIPLHGDLSSGAKHVHSHDRRSKRHDNHDDGRH